MKTTLKVSIIFFVLIFNCNSIFCQNNSNIISINPKLGSYFSVKTFGILMGIETEFTKENKLYSIITAYNEEFSILGPQPIEHSYELGFLVGNYKDKSIFRFEYQCGISYLRGIQRTYKTDEGFLSDTYASKKFQTIGFASKIGTKIIPIKCMSLGLDFETFISPGHSMLMTSLNLGLGKLRDKKIKN